MEMDNLRRDWCLYLDCEYDNKTCNNAKKLYALAVEENHARKITRCPRKVAKQG